MFISLIVFCCFLERLHCCKIVLRIETLKILLTATVHIHTHTHSHTHTHTHIHTHTFTHTHSHIHTHIPIHIHTLTCTYTIQHTFSLITSLVSVCYVILGKFSKFPVWCNNDALHTLLQSQSSPAQQSSVRSASSGGGGVGGVTTSHYTSPAQTRMGGASATPTNSASMVTYPAYTPTNYYSAYSKQTNQQKVCHSPAWTRVWSLLSLKRTRAY